MATVGELIVNLKANTAAIQTDLKKAEGMFSGFGSSTSETLAVVGRLSAGMALSVGASLLYMGKQAIDAADHIFDMSQKTGLSAEFLSSVGHIARQSGSDLDSLAAAATKMSKSAVEAASGSAEQALTYKALGVAVKDAQGHMRSTEQLFVDVTRSLASMGEGTTTTALAMRVFGKSGAEMIPFIQAFGGNIDKAKAKAQELGILVSTDMAKRADEWNDSLESMSAMLKGFGNDLAWTLLVITDYFKKSAGWLQINRAVAEHTALEEAALKATAAAATKRAEDILLGEKAAASLAKHSKEIQEFITNLREQSFEHGKTAVAVNLHKAALLGITDPKILNNIRNLSVALQDFATKAIRPKLELPAEFKAPEIAVDPAVLERMHKLADVFGLMRTQAIHLQAPISELQESMRKLGERTGDAFRTAMLHGRGFGDVLKSLLVDLSQLLLKMAFGKSIEGMIGKGGGSAIFGSLFKGLLGFAGGGDFMAGQAIRVGEQGPEVAVFNRPGTIIAHGALAAAGGGVTVNNYYIDARASDLGAEHRVRRGLAAMERRAVAAALATQRERSRRTA